MFLKFMGAALRQAPGAWWSAVTGSVSSVLASTVQGTVFGGRDSAFAVVTNTDVANWQDLGRSADTLNTALGGAAAATSCTAGPQRAVDGFRQRGADPGRRGRRAAGLEPVPVGSGVGVLAVASDVVPSAAESFSSIPTSLSAVIGVSSVEPADVLGVADLRERLQRAYSDPAAGVEARTAGTDLEGWQRVVSKGYAWQVGSILADFCTAPAARSSNWWARSSRPPTGCRPTSDCRRASGRSASSSKRSSGHWFWYSSSSPGSLPPAGSAGRSRCGRAV